MPPSLIHAYGEPLASGLLRAQPEDFQVREWLGFEADGDGEHLLLIVRKRGANSMWVARELARQARSHPRDVGFAGLKDRDAVTEQAFTVPAQKTTPEMWLGFKGEGFEVISAARHRRKLRRGSHKGNDFCIVVRDLQIDMHSLKTRLDAISDRGVPNYFGSQRFGRGGANLTAAEAWFAGGLAPRDRAQRGFALSAARAALFNRVLAARVQLGTWRELLDGDVANLDGSGSVFRVDRTDDVLRERCETLDIHPTGPMWGQGELMTQGAVAELEARIVGESPALAQGLKTVGLNQERRALRIRVENLAWEQDGAMLTLNFRLHRGAFATAVLSEIVGSTLTEMEEGDDA